jgi:thiamine biosynthesis lipoprotein
MPRPSPPPVSRFAREAMSTLFEIFVAGEDEAYAGQAAGAAFGEIDRIERLFSRFDPSSEISRIGRLGPGDSMRVGIETIECLTIAAEIQEATGGAFDVNVRACERSLPSQESPPVPSRLFDLLRLSRAGEGFEIARPDGYPERGSVRIDLDLGAIGKGYALDRALDILRDWDVSNALLHAGTSTVLAFGNGSDPQGKGPGWPVGISGGWPCREAPKRVRLRNRALSGSGTEVKGEHIRDPRVRNGKPGHLAAWASHRSATAADALSTAFMVMGTDEVRSYCEAHPEVWALVIPGPKTCRIFNRGVIAP